LPWRWNGSAGRSGPSNSTPPRCVSIPGTSGAQLNLGIALAQAGRLPEALAHLEQAVQLDPKYPNAHCNLGLALAEGARVDKAVALPLIS
jgi:Flp pilus assembly protein TadD